MVVLNKISPASTRVGWIGTGLLDSYRIPGLLVLRVPNSGSLISGSDAAMSQRLAIRDPGFLGSLSCGSFRSLIETVLTHIHTNAKRYGFDMDVAQFISGHTKGLDPNKYDKLTSVTIS